MERVWEGKMKKFVLISIIIFSSAYANNNDENYVVYYFGASNCGFCNIPKNIENIKKIRKEFSKKHNDIKTKFVMVCFDNDIDEGLLFIKKYGYWDEISIGQRYKNDLSLNILNKTEIPGLPHIIVIKNTYQPSEKMKSIPIVKKKKILVDLVGGKTINKWIDEGYPLDRK